MNCSGIGKYELGHRVVSVLLIPNKNIISVANSSHASPPHWISAKTSTQHSKLSSKYLKVVTYHFFAFMLAKWSRCTQWFSCSNLLLRTSSHFCQLIFEREKWLGKANVWDLIHFITKLRLSWSSSSSEIQYFESVACRLYIVDNFVHNNILWYTNSGLFNNTI